MKKPEIKCEMLNGRPYYYVPLGKHVVRAIGVCGGEPVFKFTRIDVAKVLGRLAGGETVDQLVQDYEGAVTKESIIEAAEIVQKIILKHLPPLPEISEARSKVGEISTKKMAASKPGTKRTSKRAAA